MQKDLHTAIQDRRSYYGIGNMPHVSDDRILEIINHAVKHCPSAFNSQGARTVVLFGEHHKKLWDIAMETLKKRMSAEKFAPTQDKINSFKSGYGTVLYFEDTSVIEALQNKFPSYKDNFPVWAQQSNGMLQYIIWTSLEAEGLGASLQHYNPLIDSEVKQQWGIPDHWKLIAEMPFGNIVAPTNEKQFVPLEERIKVFK